ncbi:GvpL/GvpF family gas vesicle protein [Streptomyces sp. Je 1-79]|uniref:GvpL/GvpF family gas vesicle protein n=1 Tax=Streptomyces sp. Je 1-79 TaxID=2943847 RepID=UPI0021A50D7E|nr:GvpL/GvpF family gas vesicle protein [Streptomyces sp. Je 1-79]MCT4357063.1 GvpL/GvpF family gas vesicle protein [Streptomyces sp. Je 1-79]
MNDHAGLTYVYAVAPDTRALRDSLAGVRGISGAPVFLLGENEESPYAAADPGSPDAVAFVAGRVSRQEFDEPTLKRRFEDLEWLEGVARAHHEVVQTVAGHDTVLPLRMATVYQNDDRARQALAAQRSAFVERLSLLRGRSELGVKLYVSPAPPSTGGEAPADSADAAPLSPGKAYLKSRRAQHSERETRYQRAERVAERVEDVAARFTRHRVRHPAQRGELAGGPEENVLNDAYLVPADQTDAFRAALTGAVEDTEGVRIEVTGPWAPYSFAMPPPPPSAPAPQPSGEAGRAP